MITKICVKCKGGGTVWNLLTEEVYPCPHCGGHRVTPVTGQFWFYRPRDGKSSPEIAHVHQDEDGRFIIDYYDERGPRGKSIEPAETAFYELRNYKASQAAPRLLDHWSNRPAWREGLKQLEVVALFNLLSCGNFWKEACEAHGRSLDETLANLQALKAQHMPEASTF